MKILMLMADDGLSTKVWLQMARGYLQAGKTVLAITDSRNTHEVIGTGDGLCSYDQGLNGHPGFQKVAVGSSREDAVALLERLKALEETTVVMFNMSPFEFFDDPGWRAVVDYCARGQHEMVVSSYYPSAHWRSDLEHLMRISKEVPALAEVDWDYIAGYRIVAVDNLQALRQLFRRLTSQIRWPAGAGVPAEGGVAAWQVINRSGTYELRRPYARVREDLESIPEMWDVQFDLSTLESPADESEDGEAPTKRPSVLHRFSLALKSLW